MVILSLDKSQLSNSSLIKNIYIQLYKSNQEIQSKWEEHSN